MKRVFARLSWNNPLGEGRIKIDQEFHELHYVQRIDMLDDWIYELKNERDRQMNSLRINSALKNMLFGD